MSYELLSAPFLKMGCYYLHLHFADLEMGMDRCSNLPQVTWLARNKTRFKPDSLGLGSCSLPLGY